MWIKIKTWVKKNLPWLAVTVGALVGFLVGRRTVGTSQILRREEQQSLSDRLDFSENKTLKAQVQLEQLAGQLEVAERLVGPSRVYRYRKCRRYRFSEIKLSGYASMENWDL